MEIKDYIALYAAIISTLTGGWQIRNWLLDRAKLKLTAQLRQQQLSVTATNTGRRPVMVDRLRVVYRTGAEPIQELIARPKVLKVPARYDEQKWVDGKVQLAETQNVVIDIELHQAVLRAQLIDVLVDDSTGHAWGLCPVDVRRLEDELRAAPLESLFPERKPQRRTELDDVPTAIVTRLKDPPTFRGV